MLPLGSKKNQKEKAEKLWWEQIKIFTLSCMFWVKLFGLGPDVQEMLSVFSLVMGKFANNRFFRPYSLCEHV